MLTAKFYFRLGISISISMPMPRADESSQTMKTAGSPSLGTTVVPARHGEGADCFPHQESPQMLCTAEVSYKSHL